MPRVLVVDDSPTVRKVVERTLLGVGYEVSLAADGEEGLELAQRQVPDLVLTDYVMPRMNGLELCKALHAIANLREVPVVLMSARMERIGERQLTDAGVLDAISKPFPPEALLAVTAHALALAEGRPSRTEPPPPKLRAADQGLIGNGADDLDAEPARGHEPPDTLSDDDAPSPDELGASQARLEAWRNALERLLDAVSPAVTRIAPGVERAALGAALRADLQEDALAQLAADLSWLASGSRGSISFEGRLDHVPPSEILQMLFLQKQTGVLEIRNETRTVSVCLRTGLVDLALGRGLGPEFLLGRYLLEDDLVEKDDLEGLIRNRAGSRRLLGEQMVKLGYITLEDLRAALVRQTSELVYDVLRWRHGQYRFERFALRHEARAAKLGLPVSSILLEGVRRVDEWRLIEEQVRSFDEVLVREPDALAMLGEERLSREERVVLDSVDGRRAVREVIEHARLGSFATCKILFRLVAARAVRPRHSA